MHRRELSNSFAARYSGTRLHVQHGQQYRQSAVLYALACSTVIQEPQKMKAYVFSSVCLLYTSPSPRDLSTSRMPSSA